jgi:hypothetical protein
VGPLFRPIWAEIRVVRVIVIRENIIRGNVVRGNIVRVINIVPFFLLLFSIKTKNPQNGPGAPTGLPDFTGTTYQKGGGYAK